MCYFFTLVQTNYQIKLITNVVNVLWLETIFFRKYEHQGTRECCFEQREDICAYVLGDNKGALFNLKLSFSFVVNFDFLKKRFILSPWYLGKNLEKYQRQLPYLKKWLYSNLINHFKRRYLVCQQFE